MPLLILIHYNYICFCRKSKAFVTMDLNDNIRLPEMAPTYYSRKPKSYFPQKVIDFCGWLCYWFVLQGGTVDATQQKSTIKTTEEKTAGAALVRGLPGRSRAFALRG